MAVTGTNRRYAAHFDRLADERIAESIARGGGLQSLTASELQLDVEALTVDPQPKPVTAWVRFFAIPLRVEGMAERWTSRAVGVRFEVAGVQYKCWVWSSAVQEGHLMPRDAGRPGSSDGRHRRGGPSWMLGPSNSAGMAMRGMGMRCPQSGHERVRVLAEQDQVVRAARPLHVVESVVHPVTVPRAHPPW